MSVPPPQDPRQPGEFELLVCILNDADLLDDVLAGMLEGGAVGATVYEGRGMWDILASEVPIFTGLRSIFPASGRANRTIFSVISREKTDGVIAIIRDIVGDIGTPGTGILFTLPVLRVTGLARDRA